MSRDKHCRVLLTLFQKTNKMDCQALRHSVDSFLENMVEYEVGVLENTRGSLSVSKGGDTCILASWLGDSGCRLILRTLLVHRSRYKTFRRFVSIFLILLLFKANNEFRSLLKRVFRPLYRFKFAGKGFFHFVGTGDPDPVIQDQVSPY